ncbi:MAG: FkbM family methyltransferase [Planctomycetia bacterium]|jgi:FkbM family methyltransferase|nr:FkbM family methyltransferase [Planctomycetia bacterium]NDH95284.1 FkbM family methyltransferase [Planctomycetia bacterium]
MMNLLKCFGDTRRQLRRAVPPGTFSSVRLALAYQLARGVGGTLVQIGACDGTAGDPISQFVRRGVMRAVLVEPVEDHFRKLEKTYSGVAGVSLVQAAVAHEDGEAIMYRARRVGRWENDDWVGQVSSFDPKHLTRHGVKPTEIETISVPAISLASLLRQFEMNQLDFLQIDAEGFDAEVVKMAMELPDPPSVVNFERMHLTVASLKEVFGLLESRGYSWIHDRFDTLALHQRFTEALSS